MKKNKPHGSTGNRNAFKLDKPEYAMISIRVEKAFKAELVKKASERNLSLSKYIKMKLK